MQLAACVSCKGPAGLRSPAREEGALGARCFDARQWRGLLAHYRCHTANPFRRSDSANSRSLSTASADATGLRCSYCLRMTYWPYFVT